MNDILKKLQDLNLKLPKVATPVANYLPYKIEQDTIYISGQLPMLEGKVAYQGKLGGNITVLQGQDAAKLCLLNILAQVNHALEGKLENIESCVKLGIFINSVADFIDHAQVGNGASNLMVDLLGDKGRHARFAMGAHSLPLNAAVEIDAIFKIKK
jgi:enamine deaminase RidA (YjgF/YER057c/UK114 family)